MDVLQLYTDIIRRRQLQLFGHTARSEPETDHRRALRVPQFEDRQLTGNDLEGWSRTVENDLKPANIGLHTAWRRAQDCADWWNFVLTATLH